MKKLSLFILSLLVSVSVQAQEPSLPDISLPGQLNADKKAIPDVSDPLAGVSEELDKADNQANSAAAGAAPAPIIPALPNAPAAVTVAPAAPAATQGNKVILDKAIKEVFQAPGNTPSAKAPAVNTPVANVPAAPAAAAPAMPQAAIAAPAGTISQVVKAPSVEAPAPKQPDNASTSVTIDIPEENPDMPAVTDSNKSAKAPTASKAVVPAAVQAPVAPASVEDEKTPNADAAVAPTDTQKPAADKKAEKPAKKVAKKKVKLPGHTPKSLRQSYSSDNYLGSMSDMPPGTKPVAGMPSFTTPGTIPGAAPAAVPASLAPQIAPTNPPARKLPASLKQSSFEDNDLDSLGKLPAKHQSLDIKNNITIDRGDFKNPFGDDNNQDNKNGNVGAKKSEAAGDAAVLTEVTTNSKKANKDISKDTGQPDESGTPVVDFSNAEPLEEIKSHKSASEDFYMKDKGLQVEVKDAPVNSIGDMKNAYNALKVGQYESAIKYYNQALSISPTDKKAMFGLATAYHMSKQYDNAKDEYLKIINLDSSYYPAVNNYIILLTQQYPEKSIEKLEDLYHRNPSFSTIPAQLGSLYFNKGNVQKSVDYYSAALKLEPTNVEYKYNLAVILEKAKQYADAATLYKSLLDDAAKGAELPESPITIRDRYFEIVSKS